MSRTKKTGVDEIRRWKSEGVGPRWGSGSGRAPTFADDLALFERQVREEAEPGRWVSGRRAFPDRPAARTA